MKLKKASKSFRANWYDYKQIKRVGNIVLYEQTKQAIDGFIKAYEVHKIRVQKVRGVLVDSPSFKDYTHYEARAGNEDFGAYGWSFDTLFNATHKFNELVKKEAK